MNSKIKIKNILQIKKYHQLSQVLSIVNRLLKFDQLSRYAGDQLIEVRSNVKSMGNRLRKIDQIREVINLLR